MVGVVRLRAARDRDDPGVLGPRDSAPADPAWRLTTLAHRGGRGRVDLRRSTRGCRRPDGTHRRADGVFFVGLLVFASVLMLRQPLFFVFMISGFFYASVLRPLPLAVVGVGATSILVNTLIAGLPADARGVDLLPRDHRHPDGRRSARAWSSARRSTSRTSSAARPSPSSRRRSRRTPGLHAQLLAQAREAGVLDERGAWRARSTTPSPRA